MTISYITSSGSTSTNPYTHHHYPASPQYSTESSSTSPSQPHQPNGYGLDPVQQYARIIYEHTRRQLDNASSSSVAAAAQQSHRGRESDT